jgi:hypothetical protein
MPISTASRPRLRPRSWGSTTTAPGPLVAEWPERAGGSPRAGLPAIALESAAGGLRL